MIRALTAQASVVVRTAYEYPASVGVVHVSVESGWDEARERARASMRIPRDTGRGHS